MRVTNSVPRKRRHKKILKLAKGYCWGRKNLYRLAKNAVTKAGQHAYKHRRQKKREFRQLWILRISAALRLHNVSYSRFMFGMAEKKVVINRKMLADIAVRNPEVFGEIVQIATA
ncbi:50S ribosomal protein L20 [Candidatus Peregrinibacteria bacterium]|nr:MAG: 50S ribosomal protein L20 [Candidatus Peregrinibacteria bacterium]